MDKFVVRAKDQFDLFLIDQLHSRTEVKRRVSLLSAYETHGRILSAFKPYLLKLLLQSYSEFAVFPFAGIIGSRSGGARLNSWGPAISKSPYVSYIDFDSKGIYLASVNNIGSLKIYEFETLYCSYKEAPDSETPASVYCTAISTTNLQVPLVAVRWNPANQDEVACVDGESNRVEIFDIACDSGLPSQVLSVKESIHSRKAFGLYALTFVNSGSSRVLASGKNGHVYMWDRRASKLSYASLPTSRDAGASNSIQLSRDEQMVYTGTTEGYIQIWDLRGGKSSAAFVTSSGVYHEALRSVKLAAILSKISSLRAQTDIGTSAIHAISLNPACGQQLAFHLNCGWSGVLDMNTLGPTHIHCPPPPWSDVATDRLDPNVVSSIHPATDWRQYKSARCLRRPVWFNSWPVYAVGSGAKSEVKFLDFAPGPKSRLSIDFNGSSSEDGRQPEVHTTDPVVALAAHPLNDTLVAGTDGGHLLLIGQKKKKLSSE